jgi:methyl-accepting chemotaxis protein
MDPSMAGGGGAIPPEVIEQIVGVVEELGTQMEQIGQKVTEIDSRMSELDDQMVDFEKQLAKASVESQAGQQTTAGWS